MSAETLRNELLERYRDEGIVAGRMFGSWAIVLEAIALYRS